jgi:putative ABC transport system permease protein
MFYSKLKIFIRNIFSKPLYPVISTLVLSIGIACVLLASVWIRYEMSYDSSFKNAHRIYRLTIEKNDLKSGYHTHIARSWFEWLKNIKNDVPGISDFGRFSGRGETTIKIDSSLFNSMVLKAGDDFIRMFSIQFIEGDPGNALKEPNTAIISESAATRYFSSRNPLGTIVQEYQQNSMDRKAYKITAIVKDLPLNSHFHFDLALAADESDIKNFGWAYNYLLLDENAEPSQILDKFGQFARKYTDEEEAKTLTPHLQKLTDIHLESSKDRELEENGNKKTLYLLGSLALFVFLVSTLNFLNLQYVVFLRKQKAISVLNYAGAGFPDHMVSQLLETFIYSSAAALTGLFLFESVQKFFNLLMGKSPDAGRELVFSTFVVLIPAIIIFISLAGLYPLLLIEASRKIASAASRHSGLYDTSPAEKGKRHRVLKVLIAIQYTFSIILIIVIIVVNRQVKLIMDHRLGSHQDNILCIRNLPVQVHNNYQLFRSELLSSPYIKDVTCSFEDPSSENLDMMQMDTEDANLKEKALYVYPADDNFFDFYKLSLVAGRNFKKFSGNDSISEDYILNESALRYLGWKPDEAIGKSFRLKFEIEDKNLFHGGTIVGIVKDFQMSSMKNNIKPYVFFQKSFWLFSAQVKYDSVSLPPAMEQIERTWKKLYPDYPLEYIPVVDLYTKIYKNELQLKNLSTALGIIAIILSCLGLWGITGIIYESKTKEIGIRKINGAKIIQIIGWLLKDILIIVVCALAVAVPISLYLTQQWLNNFAYKIPLRWWIFFVAGAGVLLIAILTVSLQSWKTATRNPVDSLRYE